MIKIFGNRTHRIDHGQDHLDDMLLRVDGEVFRHQFEQILVNEDCQFDKELSIKFS